MTNGKENDATTASARALRIKQTDAERILWHQLRAKRVRTVKFRRQQPIGPYIVDFISFDLNLIIELDGGQHNFQTGMHKDTKRTKELENRGYRVIRFWNNDVLQNLAGVLESLREYVE